MKELESQKLKTEIKFDDKDFSDSFLNFSSDFFCLQSTDAQDLGIQKG